MCFDSDGYFSARDRQLAAEREAEMDADAANERAFRANPAAFRNRMGAFRSSASTCDFGGIPIHEAERYCRSCAVANCAQRNRILSED